MRNKTGVVMIPEQPEYEAMEAMRLAHAKSMLAHGSASTAMNAAVRALLGYYKRKNDNLPGIGAPKPAVQPKPRVKKGT